MPQVVLVNVHGGFPSAMIERSLCELPGFAQLAAMGCTHERAYPSNACAGPALHDSLMDAPMCAMADSAWHRWAFAQRATRSLFHVFRQHGFHTRLVGCFGLDPSREPATHLHVECDDLCRALEMHGIDECDGQDAAFTCQCARAHDDDALRRAALHLDGADAPANAVTVVNLLGCQDAHRCLFAHLDPARTGRQLPEEPDERRFAPTVVEDDARCRAAASHRVEALRRAALAHDWIRGTYGAPDRDETVRAVSGMHALCWKCLRRIDAGLQAILDALERRDRLADAIIYLYSDHPLSLYEHGEMCEAPWEACLRSFCVRKAPRCAVGRSGAPFSLRNLAATLCADVGLALPAGWRQAAACDDCCLTLGLACSWLGRASVAPAVDPAQLRTFFLRALVVLHDRPYAVTFWFSLSELAFVAPFTCKNPVCNASLADFASRDALQVFEHVTDPHERRNLAADAAWLSGATGRELKARVDEAIRAYDVAHLLLRTPDDPSSLAIEDLDLCSVQLHHRATRRVAARRRATAPPPTATAQTQTESTTLLSALTAALGAPTARAIHATLPAETDVPLTVFVPQGGHAPPPPLRGAYARDVLLRIARERTALIDVRGEAHPVLAAGEDEVAIGKWSVDLTSATTVVHSRGYAIAYRLAGSAGPTEPPAEPPPSGGARTSRHAAARKGSIAKPQARTPSVRQMEHKHVRLHH